MNLDSTEDKRKLSAMDTHAQDQGEVELSVPESSAVRPVLMIFDTNKLHEWYMIVQEETRIGRDPEVDILLNDDAISRIHARIVFENIDRPLEEPRCVLEDNDSRNGTYLNGKRVSQPTLLRNGDRVFIGSTCLAYFVRTELEINSDQKLRSLATTDALTGLANRGFMAIEFQREYDRSKRYRRPLSLLMLDLDNFKKINDTYGHTVGDQVLEQFARVVMGKTRVHDIAARYGGEEFAILLPETSLQGALVIAERLRKTVQNHEFQTKGPRLRLTVSIGLAEIDYLSETRMTDLVDQADEALLRAKREGKNRVCVWGVETNSRGETVT